MSNEHPTPEKEVEDIALAYFTEYFARNYPGPNTIIGNPLWHAPKIFRNVLWSLKQAERDTAQKRGGLTDCDMADDHEEDV